METSNDKNIKTSLAVSYAYIYVNHLINVDKYSVLVQFTLNVLCVLLLDKIFMETIFLLVFFFALDIYLNRSVFNMMYIKDKVQSFTS